MRFGSLSFLMYLFMLVCYTHVFPSVEINCMIGKKSVVPMGTLAIAIWSFSPISRAEEGNTLHEEVSNM